LLPRQLQSVAELPDREFVFRDHIQNEVGEVDDPANKKRGFLAYF
jgi:hypothetical protein